MGLKQGSAAQRLSSRFRRGRDERLRSLIDRISDSKPRVAILDMGGSVEYWSRVGFDYLRSRNCHVTIVNLEDSEIGETSAADLFTLAVGDACALPQFADRSFDLTHSNSVVEHLRSWSAMKAFAAETRRLAANYYVQTPNFWFPIDPHYYRFPLFHWLPRPMRASLFRKLPVAHSGRAADWERALDLVDASRLLDRQQMYALFPDGTLHAERVAGLSKSLIAIRVDPAVPPSG